MSTEYDATTPDSDRYFDDKYATFGDRIVSARENLGLTHNQLANRLGIKSETLAKWEEDRSEPRANKLQMLAGVLNVSMIWLMTGEGDGIAPSQVDETHSLDILLELRAIRSENSRLTERLGRLEKRLRGVL